MRPAIEQVDSRCGCNGMASCPPQTLRQPRWRIVCVQSQLFTKNRVNSSATGTKKGRPRAPFEDRYEPHLRQIGSRRLTLRELERLAGLGAAVLLALDHARVAGEEAALLEDAAQIRLEIGQRLRD